MKKSLSFALLCVAIMVLSLTPASYAQTPQILDPSTIPKFINQLNQPPPTYTPTNITDDSGKLIRQEYTVSVTQFTQQMLPTTNAAGVPTGFATTKVWGYSGLTHNTLTGQSIGVIGSTPGCTFQTTQGIPVRVKWVNNLIDANGNPLSYFVPVDPTIHWANPNNIGMAMTLAAAPLYPPGYPDAQASVAIVPHLHGGETPSSSDGHPNAWFTSNGNHGPAYISAIPTDENAVIYEYPNAQQPTTLWYHDHALGLTRLNVLSGLAGFYIITNPADPLQTLLPSGEYEMPLAIQDRTFLNDGSLYYPTVGLNPEVNPYWQPMFLGNAIIVNGEAWPNMNVKQGQYRFRILDGSNNRFYTLSFSNGMPFTQIGTDGGYLKGPATLTSKNIAPAERLDILVDFSNIPAGEKIILRNLAESESAPTSQIMQFTIVGETGFASTSLPQNLNPTLSTDYPTLPTPDAKRILTLIDVAGRNGAAMMLLDGQTWDAPVSETPKLSSTEEWVIVNPTMDTHPIHLHLVQFQVVKRQSFNIPSYLKEWTQLNGNPPLTQATKNVASLETYLIGTPRPAEASEQGWKDTVSVGSGEVLTIRIRWAEQNGDQFPFDATAGPGYVWHCHILEHEDNQMMRPYTVVSSISLSGLEFALVLIPVVVVAILVVLLIFWRLKNRSNKHR
jgi:FtsP/CotA-like multicopper oxidase with cupredoxin domain